MQHPAGITDGHIEFFQTNEGLKAFYGGQIVEWNMLPEAARELAREDLQRDLDAQEVLENLELDDDARLQLYVKCKFGGFNAAPDITATGESEAEHWKCGCTECPLKSTLRGKLTASNGVLSAREIEVAKLIAQGFFGKEISARLGIAESTINTHKKRIFEKTGASSGIEITNWAIRQNLI